MHVVIYNYFVDSSRSVTAVSGGQGDPIVPRRIKPRSLWSWDETDYNKVEKLRGWWKEKCDVQSNKVLNAATDYLGGKKCSLKYINWVPWKPFFVIFVSKGPCFRILGTGSIWSFFKIKALSVRLHN